MNGNHVFPWWAGYWLLNPLRKLKLNPREFLVGYVSPGMVILDAGCAMGFFSIPLAQMTGPTGKVFCVDPQKKMLDVLVKRAEKRQLSEIIDVRLCTYASLLVDALAGRIDLALAVGVLHETRDKKAFIRDIALTLKPGGIFIFSEPHVIKPAEFEEELGMIEKSDFMVVKKMHKGHNKIAVLHKNSWNEGHQSCQRATQAA
ncbi:MAG: class I SAM-dependent methyltransferase [Deltaproteobacteria bacterium]|nr:class I SAM-dependent methyltransferase [Deltaproteobacteria bacterium]